MIRLIAYVHVNRKNRFSLYIKLRLHKMVFILTLKNKNFKNTLESYYEGHCPSHPPIYRSPHKKKKKKKNLNNKCRRSRPFFSMSFCSNMSHVLQQTFMEEIRPCIMYNPSYSINQIYRAYTNMAENKLENIYQ